MKVIEPPAVAVAPDSVALSVIGPPMVTDCVADVSMAGLALMTLLVYVQVICSLGPTFRVAVPVFKSTDPFASLQTRSVSFQPAVGVSVIVYAPGATCGNTCVFDSVSALLPSSSSLKSERLGPPAVVNEKSCALLGIASLMIVTLPQLFRSIGKFGAASFSCELCGLPPVRLRMCPLLKPGQPSEILRADRSTDASAKSKAGTT